MNYYLAVDIGASSGRHILGYVKDGKIVLEEVFRFENRQLQIGGHTCWDIDMLRENVIRGIKACKTAGKIPVSLGVDTWAVDFLLLDKDGNAIGDAVAYRDGRTAGMDAEVDKISPFGDLYAKTGIQKQPFNTIYQLMAVKNTDPELLEKAEHLLMMPDYLKYILTGVMRQEYTNATSTALVDARGKTWDYDMIEKLGFPRRLFKPLSLPGETVGRFTEGVRDEIGFDCEVVLPATHDTASAYLAVPARDDKAVYLSSGTWSLMGIELEKPITTPDSMAQNFTNEGGYEYRFRYLKNIMGLWMIQSIRRELNSGERKYSFDDLCGLARASVNFTSVVDVEDSAFLAPESMLEAVKTACASGGQPVPQTIGEVMQCVYQSLAAGYAKTVESISTLTGREFTSINIVGGGSQDGYLNELTARATGLPVFAGPTEGTALGNIIVQMIKNGELPDLRSARECIRRSFEIKEILP